MNLSAILSTAAGFGKISLAMYLSLRAAEHELGCSKSLYDPLLETKLS